MSYILLDSQEAASPTVVGIDRVDLTLSGKALYYSIDQVVVVSKASVSLTNYIVNAKLTYVFSKIVLSLTGFATTLFQHVTVLADKVALGFTGRNVTCIVAQIIDVANTVVLSGKTVIVNMICTVSKSDIGLVGKEVSDIMAETIVVAAAAVSLGTKEVAIDVTVHIGKIQLMLEGKGADEELQCGLTRLGASMRLE